MPLHIFGSGRDLGHHQLSRSNNTLRKRQFKVQLLEKSMNGVLTLCRMQRQTEALRPPQCIHRFFSRLQLHRKCAGNVRPIRTLYHRSFASMRTVTKQDSPNICGWSGLLETGDQCKYPSRDQRTFKRRGPRRCKTQVHTWTKTAKRRMWNRRRRESKEKQTEIGSGWKMRKTWRKDQARDAKHIHDG